MPETRLLRRLAEDPRPRRDQRIAKALELVVILDLEPYVVECRLIGVHELDLVVLLVGGEPEDARSLEGAPQPERADEMVGRGLEIRDAERHMANVHAGAAGAHAVIACARHRWIPGGMEGCFMIRAVIS